MLNHRPLNKTLQIKMPGESQKRVIIKCNDIDHHCHTRLSESAEEDHAICDTISSKSNSMVTSLHPTLPTFTEHWQAQKEILNIIYRC